MDKKESGKSVVVLKIEVSSDAIKHTIAMYNTIKIKSPESSNSKPNFSQTMKPYIPDVNDATAPADVSNWGTREYFSLV